GLDDEGAASLPYASSLCGACYEVCPVKINIPEVLVHLRGKVVDKKKQEGGIREKLDPEHVGMKLLSRAFNSRKRYEQAQKIARAGQGIFSKDGVISSLPGYLSGWTATRDLKTVPKQTFREWWEERDE
ncbi:MAG TPA: lactate utilization protein LutB domain-containing protein, partial [Fodinibius sp.]|nr:lactate utilization protein LutB domain-containing protein [Fodinibius sp.]